MKKAKTKPDTSTPKQRLADELRWSGEDMQYRKRGANGKADAGSAVTGKDMRPEESASPNRRKFPDNMEQLELRKGGKVTPMRKRK